MKKFLDKLKEFLVLLAMIALVIACIFLIRYMLFVVYPAIINYNTNQTEANYVPLLKTPSVAGN